MKKQSNFSESQYLEIFNQKIEVVSDSKFKIDQKKDEKKSKNINFSCWLTKNVPLSLEVRVFAVKIVETYAYSQAV
jgi:hypothetical protein